MARFMAWHVDYFKAVPSEQGRSQVYEKGESIDTGDALLVFISFEKNDVESESRILDRTYNELASLAAQLKVSTVVLNPFAHLFGELAQPQDAMEMLDKLYEMFKDRGFDARKLSFGLFYEIELKAKGHRLSRVSRIVT
ncbi:MAG: threonyl-tRNA synthetase editing domain-containing protein [Candidatus Micrarchaeaceae archaeon]